MVDRLEAVAARRRELEAERVEVLAETRAAILAGAEAGLSAYRMARILGMNEGHVGVLRKSG